MYDSKTFSQLLGHEQFAIADRYDFAIRDAADGVDMIIGNLAATDERDPQRRLQRSEVRAQRSDSFKMNELGALIILPSIAPTSRHFWVKLR